MKQKDVITLVIASVIIATSIFFMIKIMNPPVAKKDITTEADKIKAIPSSIDEGTYERIKILSDYGEPKLDNIGKPDLFAGF